MAALAELGIWAIALVCLGLALIITVAVFGLFRWLVDILNSIPAVNIGTGWIRSVEHTVTSALGTAFGWVNAQFGASLHYMARLLDWAWRELRGHAVLLANIAATLAGFGSVVAVIRALLHHFTRSNTGQSARIKQLEREYVGIEHGIRKIERELHGIDEIHIRAQLGSLSNELHTIETQTIPAIQAGEAANTGSIGSLWEWVKQHVAVPGTDVFTGAVALAISALGLDWLRCNSNPFNRNPNACNLWGDLANLLAIAVIAGEVASLDELIGIAQEVTETIVDGAETLLQV